MLIKKLRDRGSSKNLFTEYFSKKNINKITYYIYYISQMFENKI